MRIRPLAGLSERGFSFDLVSRKKTARAEEAPEAGAEHEAPTGNPTLQLTDPILDDPDLMVEPKRNGPSAAARYGRGRAPGCR